MQVCHAAEHVSATFDEPNLIADAGLLPLANLASHAPLLPGADQVMFIDIDPTHRRVYGHAKQDPERRFHALYGHVFRRDLLWRAWSGGAFLLR